MAPSRQCSVCEAVIPSDAPEALCVQCLLALGLGGEDTSAVMEAPDLTPLLLKPAPPMAVKFHSFGDYELLEEVARGGMGVVFRAHQVGLKRLVALKFILPGRLGSPEAVKRFQAEAEIAASLNHPNIVPIYEIGEGQGHPYFTMKLVESGTLAQRLSDYCLPIPASLSPAEHAVAKAGIAPRSTRLVTLLAQVARAVHFAHQHGILHRDLKPSNILLDTQGQPLLTDFGLAKILQAEVDLTASAELLGSPQYMSPEQATGRCNQLTSAADIYSLGAILYELLTGQPPFRGDSPLEVLQQVRERPPKAVRAINPLVDGDLETICLKCLQKEPDRRYGSAEALAEDLERWLAREPILARRASTTKRLWLWCRRNTGLAGLAAGMVLLLVAVAVGASIAAWEINSAREAERQERHRAEQARSQAMKALTQMEAIQLYRAEECLEAGNRLKALPYLALVLRQNPSHRIAAERLMSVLSHHNFARLACPPLLHSNRVTSAGFSRDGCRVVTAAADNTARIWDAATGRCVAGPLAHQGEINTAEFSPDGRRVVTASQDGTARVWDARTGAPLTNPLEHQANVWLARFSSDSRRVVTGCDDGTAQVWDIASGRRVFDPLPHNSRITSLDLSPDGQWIATAEFLYIARIWSMATGELLHALPHDAVLRSIHFSPDGHWLVTSADDDTARVWDASTGRLVAKPFHHNGRGWDAEFSPEGRRIVTGSGDGTVQIWDVRTGQPIGRPLQHNGEVRSAVFSPEGLRVVTSSWDKTVRVWDALTGEPLTESIPQESGAFYAEFDAGGRRVLTAANSQAVCLWYVAGGQPLKIHLPEPVSSAEFSGDGLGVVLGTEQGLVSLWDLHNARPMLEPWRHPGPVLDARFSPDGNCVAVRLQNQPPVIHHLRTGKLIHLPVAAGMSVACLQFSPDGRKIVTSTGNQAVRIFDVVTGDPLTAPIEHGDQVLCAAFSSDGRRLVTASADHTARVWDALTGQPITPSLRHQGPVQYAEFSHSGHQVVTAAADMTAQVWDVSIGQRIGPPLLHRIAVELARFSPDDDRVVTTSKFGARLWDARTGRPLTDDFGGGAARFSPDGGRVLTAKNGLPAQLWDAWTGQRLTEALPQDDKLVAARFSPDGRFIVTGFTNGTVRLWEVPAPPLPVPAWLPDLAEAIASQRFNQQGLLEPVSARELWSLRQKAAQDSDPGFYSRWAKWFFADPDARTVLPSSPLTLPQYADRLIAMDTLPSLVEAARLVPTNGVALARLARRLLDDQAATPRP